MHTIIRRVCYVLLFGLVIEGALTFPLLAIWYGVPGALTGRGVQRAAEGHVLRRRAASARPTTCNSPPFGGTAEAEDQTTVRGRLGRPAQARCTHRVDFRELVENKERERRGRSRRRRTPTSSDRRDEAARQAASPSSPERAAASDGPPPSSSPAGAAPLALVDVDADGLGHDARRPSRHAAPRRRPTWPTSPSADRMAELPDEVLDAPRAPATSS